MKKKIFFIATLALIITSCKNSHDHTNDSHAVETEKVKITAYNPDFELFAEADPFVVGDSSNVLTHFSHLPSFKALESGSITIRLIVGSKEISQTLEKPTRKGIFSFNLKSETAGSGKIIFDIKTSKGTFQLITPEITVYSDKNKAIDAAQKQVPSRTNAIVFTKEQAWKIEYATEFPLIEPFGQVIKTSAQVQSAQGDEVIVSAKTNGIIIFTSNNILEGKNVKNSQALFTISGSTMAENNSTVRYAEAQNNYELTKSDYERKKELAKDKIVSEKDFLKSKNDFENAKTIYDNLSKNFSTAGQSVSSPMNGFVKQLFVKNGQYVEAGQSIVSISQNLTLLLKADVQQKYAPFLGSINSATIKTIHDAKTYSLEQLNGKILSYGRTANDDNYLIPVSLQIDNKGSFIPGGYVEILLKIISNTNALTVPNSALIEEQGYFFVFVQINPELFEKREIKIGATDGLKTEVISGINKNERVVTKGAILIKLAQATGTLDPHSGHNH
ncbi:MAG: efflux RND transporter periplasmic adaptor subunit [Paludibacter sp.]|nr:efflux RND transporter periplasmic adaptor subunit [Paludibacter sp.]